MHRRGFLSATAAGAASVLIPGCSSLIGSGEGRTRHRTGPGYASPQDAMRAPREKLLYTVGIYTGTKINAPDYLATIDVDPASPNYSKVIHRLPMPEVGDELHHFGWNSCSSCHGDSSRSRRYMVVPGIRSSRIHIIDTKNPSAPTLHKVIDGESVKGATKLSAPHTVHCLADGTMLISMLGDAAGNGPGGFMILDDRFDIAGRWEKDATGMQYSYDYWYQPRHNVMVSSEFAAPNTYYPGFDIKHVGEGKYGRKLYFWDWKARKIAQTFDLGEQGNIPLEVRFHHNPDSSHGFVGAALSSVIWHWHKPEGKWKVEKVVEVPSVEVQGWPFPVPGLITDILISMDDRFLYFSNWLHGDIRQYDITDPSRPRLAGQVWCGGVIGKEAYVRGRKLTGGPQMLQQSFDGKRLYVTNSLLSSWDNQFYPAIAEKGTCMLQVDCDTNRGGMKINENFLVDFGKEPQGPARAHEMRFPDGDCSSDIWT